MRGILACGLVLVCHLPVFSQARPPETSLTPSEYVAELDRLLAALDSASPVEARALAASVPLRWRVVFEGQQVAVDGAGTIHALRAATDSPGRWPQVRASVRKRLGEMRSHGIDLRERDDLATARRDVRTAIHDVLGRPEFRRSASPSWFEHLQQRIAEWVRSLFRRIGADRMPRRETAIVFAWIAAVAALAGLGIWLARMLAAPSGAGPFGLTRGMPRRVSSREWAMRATAARRAGNVREAVRCAYNGAIRRLEEQGTWRLEQSRTPREYLRILKTDDRRREHVQELTEQFEQIWYGNRPINEYDAQRLGMNLEKLGCLSVAEREI